VTYGNHIFRAVVGVVVTKSPSHLRMCLWCLCGGGHETSFNREGRKCWQWEFKAAK